MWMQSLLKYLTMYWLLCKTNTRLLFFCYGQYVQVQAICLILTKSLSRQQRFQREAAAAALSEFVRYRFVQNDLCLKDFLYYLLCLILLFCTCVDTYLSLSLFSSILSISFIFLRIKLLWIVSRVKQVEFMFFIWYFQLLKVDYSKDIICFSLFSYWYCWGFILFWRSG